MNGMGQWGLGPEDQTNALVVRLQSAADDDDDELRKTAGKLLTLAEQFPGLRVLIMHAGGLERLLQLLSSEAPKVRSAAVAVLCELAQDADCRSAILRADGVGLVVQLLQGSEIEQLWFAAATLAVVVQACPAAGLAVLRAQGIPLLTGLLSNSEVTLQQHAAAVLEGVAYASDECAAGTIQQLLQVASSSIDSTTQQNAAAALKNIVANTAATALQPAAGSTTLADMLAAATATDDIVVKCTLTQIVLQVCQTNSSCAQGISKAAATHIAHLLGSSDQQLQRVAAEVVQLLSVVDTASEAAAAEYLLLLLQLLRSPDAVVQASAAAALQHLVVNAGCWEPELQAACVQQLLDLHQDSPQQTVQHANALFLSLVDGNPVAAVAAAAAAGGLGALLGYESNIQPQLQQKIVDAVTHLATCSGSSELAPLKEQVRNIQWLAPLVCDQLCAQSCKTKGANSGASSYSSSGSEGSNIGSSSSSSSSHSGGAGSRSNSSSGGTGSISSSTTSAAASDAARDGFELSGASAAADSWTSNKHLTDKDGCCTATEVGWAPDIQSLLGNPCPHIVTLTTADAVIDSQPPAEVSEERMARLLPAATVEKADDQSVTQVAAKDAPTAVQVAANKTQTAVQEPATQVAAKETQTAVQVAAKETQTAIHEAAVLAATKQTQTAVQLVAKETQTSVQIAERETQTDVSQILSVKYSQLDAQQLVQHLGSQDSTQQAAAAAELARRARIPEQRMAIHSASGTSALADVLRCLSVHAHNDEWPALWVDATVALSHFACDASTMQDIKCAIGCKQFVRALKQQDRDLQQLAAAALASLAADGAAVQNGICHAGGIPALLSILQAGAGPDKALQRLALTALANIAADNPQSQQNLLQAQAVPLLLVILQTPDVCVQRGAAAALANLAAGSASRQERVNGASVEDIRLLLPLLHSRDAVLQISVATALYWLASTDEDVAAMIHTEGGVTPLQLFQPAKTVPAATEQGQHAAGVRCEYVADIATNQQGISNASQQDQLQGFNSLESIHACGDDTAADAASKANEHITLLVAQLHSKDPDLQAAAALTLMDCTADGHSSAEAIFEAGGVRPLVLLLGSSSAQTQKHAAAAVANLAKCGPNICQAICSSCGVGLMLHLLRQPDEELQAHATSALLHLVAWDAELVPILSDADIVQQLAQLLDSHSSQAQQNALAVLLHIVPAAHDAVIKAGAVEQLVRLVLKSDDVVKNLAAQILAALSSRSTENEQAIHQAAEAIADSLGQDV